MSLVARYRLQFLVAWLALDARVRAALSPRQIPSVAPLLGQARALEQWLHPWLVALLSRRGRLGWTLPQPERRGWSAEQIEEDVELGALEGWELRQWSAEWLQYWLEAELARLVWLLETPCVQMRRPGWDRWEVARWALAGGLARICQLERALEQRQGRAAGRAGFERALDAVWARLTAANAPGAGASM